MGLPEEDRPISYPSVLTVLGRDHEQAWREKAHEQVTRAVNSLADKQTFGGTPGARAFASVYAAALAEYTATLRGAQADLVTAAENLALAAEEMRSRDENAGAAFVTLLARWTDPSGFESQQRQDEARDSEESQEGATTMAGLTEGQGSGSSGSGGTAPTTDMPTGDGSGNGGGGSGGNGGTASGQPVVATGGPVETGPTTTMATGPGAGPGRPNTAV